MEIVTAITLNNGRTIRSDSIEFRDHLPVSADLFDRLAFAEESDNPGGPLWEAIGALANAIVVLEARGVQFDD
jgi:hypothetical protein